MIEVRDVPILRTIPFLMAICLIALPAQAKYSGGSGTTDDPYQIAEVNDLILLGARTEDYGKHFILTADVNLIEAKVFDRAVIAPDTVPATSFQFDGTPFTGVFDGSGHSISHLAIKGSGSLGLFGRLGSDAQVKDLGITDANITGPGFYVGVLAGDNSGSVTDCYSTGEVVSSREYYYTQYVGGLVAYNSGRVIDCYSTTTISAAWSEYVGGLVGLNSRGTISASHATGSVTGREDVGGLVGYSWGNIEGCWATGSVTSATWPVTASGSVGGLVGAIYKGNVTTSHATGSVAGGQRCGGLVGDCDQGNIDACFSTSAVSGLYDIGGLVGHSYRGTITACYATGSVAVTGQGNYVGGLVGDSSEGTITACYATGSVTGTASRAGGLVGDGDGTFITCFWDIETSGQAGSCGGKGLTTSQMKSSTIYGNAGWAGRGWVISNGQDYPRLDWEHAGGVPIPEPERVPLSGSGTMGDPYQIWTPEDFALLSWHASILDKYISLMADLDLSGITLHPIGDLGSFQGIFDGNDCILENAVIYKPGSDYVGLFHSLAGGAQIRNLGATNITVTGREYVGSLVGYNCGILDSCHAIGDVNATGSSVGGLAGESYQGTITACSSGCSVMGYRLVGGLAGSKHGGTITASYATGPVTGTDQYVGGLAGYNTGYVTGCYSTGAVSGLTEVGGIVGFNTLTSLISGCHASGSVNGFRYVGGLVGDNHDSYAKIEDCKATGPVTGNGSASDTGGLVGRNYLGSITSCYATGNVESKSGEAVGGLVGENYYATIATSHATGSVSGKGEVGGLVGCSWVDRNRHFIRACFSTSNVEGGTLIGGLVGQNLFSPLSNCYAMGKVKGDSRVGGLVGENSGATVTACYATGSVSGNKEVGGLVGYDYNGLGIFSGSFWDVESSGQRNSNGGDAKKTSEMQTSDTFVSAGWDFLGESQNGTEDTWAICEGADYPKLTWQFVVGDFDADGHTDFQDFSVFACRWRGTDSSFWCQPPALPIRPGVSDTVGGTDLTNDTLVNYEDLALFAEGWLGRVAP
jgi:hypothetical protein